MLSNYSTHDLAVQPLWSSQDISVFNDILLIQFGDQVHRVQ